MISRHPPKPVQLAPPGPYETQAVEAFLGVAISQEELPPRACFVLQGGTELRLPIDMAALENLYRSLGEHFGD